MGKSMKTEVEHCRFFDINKMRRSDKCPFVKIYKNPNVNLFQNYCAGEERMCEYYED